jgi:hypothetical protein
MDLGGEDTAGPVGQLQREGSPQHSEVQLPFRYRAEAQALPGRGVDPAADAVMASLTPDNLKTRAIILSDVAAARVTAGDLDVGCELAYRALAATLDGQVRLSRQRLTALRPVLDEHQAAEPVRALLPVLDAAGISNTPAAA